MRIILDPEPRTAEDIFSEADYQELTRRHDVIVYSGEDRDVFYTRHLPDCEILLGQADMGPDRLAMASKLKAIINVETNFLPNVDYETCFQRGIHVLAPSGVFALPVAEMGLGMAISLARGIHSEHKRFTEGTERYGLSGNQDAELLSGSDFGFVGFGDLGRALFALLPGFRPNSVKVFDPWLPNAHLERMGVAPASLDAVLEQSRFVFVVASITTENQHLLNAGNLSRMQPGASLILLSRAAVVDFDAVSKLVGSGAIRFATDVFPEEPVTADDPVRALPNTLFSPHRAGALESALKDIGNRVIEDIGQLANGLPPISCKRAERETVSRLRSKPIDKT